MKPDALADILWNTIDLPTMDQNSSSSDTASISDDLDDMFMFDRPLDYDSSSEESSGVNEYFTRTVSQYYDDDGDEKMVQAVKTMEEEVLGTFCPVDEVGHHDVCAPSSPMKKKKAEDEEDLAPVKKRKHTASNDEFEGSELPLKKRAISYKFDNGKKDDTLGRAECWTPPCSLNPTPWNSSRYNFDSADISLETNDANCSYLGKTPPMPIIPSLKNSSVALSSNDGNSSSISKMTSSVLATPLKNVWVASSPKAIKNGTGFDLNKLTSMPVVTPMKKCDVVDSPMPTNPSLKNASVASSSNDGSSSLSNMTSSVLVTPLKNVWVASSPKAIKNGTDFDLNKLTSMPVVTPMKKRDAVVIHENKEKGIRAPYPCPSVKNEINSSLSSNTMKCKGKNVVPSAGTNTKTEEVEKEKLVSLPFRTNSIEEAISSSFSSNKMKCKGKNVLPSAATTTKIEEIEMEKLARLPFRINKASASRTTSATTTLPSKIATPQDEKWLHMFNCLQAFKNQYGHTDVKQQYAPNPSLGIWVNTQRMVLTKWLESEGDKQTKSDIKKLQRVKVLRHIGFVFSIGKGRHGNRTRIIPEYNKKGWEDQFLELLKYKATHGNCLVKLLDPNYRSLGRWVGSQRKKYREYFIAQQEQYSEYSLQVGYDDKKKKRLESITGDQELVLRYERLKDLGFDFVVRKQKQK